MAQFLGIFPVLASNLCNLKFERLFVIGSVNSFIVFSDLHSYKLDVIMCFKSGLIQKYTDIEAVRAEMNHPY